jgi:hypothetical protein
MNPEHCKTDFSVHVVNELVRFSFARPFAPARPPSDTLPHASTTPAPHRERRRSQAADGGRTRRPSGAVQVVERWNAERSLLRSPTNRCAVVAAMPRLAVYYPGCRTSRALDIRTVDRHPVASVGSLVLGLRCSWCPGNAPMPVLTGSTRYRRRKVESHANRILARSPPQYRRTGNASPAD